MSNLLELPSVHPKCAPLDFIGFQSETRLRKQIIEIYILTSTDLPCGLRLVSVSCELNVYELYTQSGGSTALIYHQLIFLLHACDHKLLTEPATTRKLSMCKFLCTSSVKILRFVNLLCCSSWKGKRMMKWNRWKNPFWRCRSRKSDEKLICRLIFHTLVARFSGHFQSSTDFGCVFFCRIIFDGARWCGRMESSGEPKWLFHIAHALLLHMIFWWFRFILV